MKALLTLLIVFTISVRDCFSQTQRLLIPRATNVKANFDGSVSLTAYCLDATRIWPAYSYNAGSSLPYIYFGGDKTFLTFQIKNGKKLPPVLLSKAISDNLVKIISNRQSITIISLKKNISIYKVSTEGLAVGEQVEETVLDNSLGKFVFSDKIGEWEKNQKQLHRTITEKEMISNEIKSKRVEEFIVNWVANKPSASLPKKARSEYWQTKKDGDIIKIHEKKIPEGGGINPDNKPFEKLYEFLENDELEDFSVCVQINPDDSSVSIKMSGKLAHFLPIEIEFDSENKLIASVSAEAEILELFGVTISVEQAITTHVEEDKDCKFSTAMEICYPPKKSNVEIDICGKKMNVGIEGITFGF